MTDGSPSQADLQGHVTAGGKHVRGTDRGPPDCIGRGDTNGGGSRGVDGRMNGKREGAVGVWPAEVRSGIRTDTRMINEDTLGTRPSAPGG